MNTVLVRLMGGPFDGDKAEVFAEQLTARIWVARKLYGRCGGHWHLTAEQVAEISSRF